ncbi:hypothetical protein J437_LFUL012179 [Ladona fulva]|uniref:Ig-like domain-containing protein n=1 Tax=Ladona fulva TaxID=123851 RepID=A0A8K0KD23_LADFU|nr:hypothetical protein J437_LFUL012179 [Ladona fulva]
MTEMKQDEPEAICVCKMQGEICGSNNYTYETQCHMALDAVKLKNPSSLYVKHAGPCHTVPVITSGPDDIAVNIGEPVALSCEVKGFPIPDIHWEFQSDDQQYSTAGKNLPSDDLFVAVQVRGGPEAYMTTSWVQIVSLRKSDMGVYTCVATNKEGATRASAKIRQY